eukprot:CAMPEP_0194694762 /NCGR_PEP_ID=MMETSP0295-20121207/21490_1 /TAXON_ID=39354 /ORGANISM="Heterosigma akashiwo, Strain CCMP2393" /LENGTH=84 /DNA_ID=CAMNT_0039586237 /DNA_START=106 /DNA_END=360 /DNA_ORIENTATION=+
MPLCKIAQAYAGVGAPMQQDHPVADGLRHLPDLPVPALLQHHPVPPGPEAHHAAGARGAGHLLVAPVPLDLCGDNNPLCHLLES